MKESVCLTLGLDSVFSRTANGDRQAYPYQYIGLNDGVFRTYPAEVEALAEKSYG